MGPMGMNSEKLSARTKQPGHDQTYRASEESFAAACRACLDPALYDVVPKPRELAKIFKRRDHDCDLGIVPEVAITSKATGRKLFIEVKKQGRAGNAEERAMKHHTVQFYRTLHEHFGYAYHPYATVFCEELATLSRYTDKFRYMIEPKQYFLWKGYDLDALRVWLNERCAEWLAAPP